MFFFFKQKTAYGLRISDWSSDVCSSDLVGGVGPARQQERADVAEPVLDGAEGGAIAAALGDVERGLAEVAALRIELAQVGEVVDPALLGARADVEVDALDRL